MILTRSGRRPCGTQVYSSRAQPESSSDWECRCPSADSGDVIGARKYRDGPCSSRGRRQWTHTFLWGERDVVREGERDVVRGGMA